VPTIPQGVRELLATGPLANVVTIDPDGTPRVTVAWGGLDGDELVMATFFNLDQPKLRNMRRDPRVVVSSQAKDHAPGERLHPYVVFQGRARVLEGGALATMDYLAQFYLGPGQQYPLRDAGDGVTVRVAIERIYGQGSWREEAGG
jgi:PPOX class probable F420-dependent enzyme